MSQIYILNTGEKVEYLPHFFEERENLKNKAKKIAEQLKWTKKISKEDFIDTYCNNDLVKEYRQLLVKIWSFVNINYIAKTLQACDDCNTTENLYNETRTLHLKNNKHEFTPWNMVKCEKCLKHEIELWGDDAIITYEKIDQ